MTRNDNIYKIKWPNLRGSPTNKTTLYLLPSIGFREEMTGMRLLNYYGFVNCYLSHKQATENYQDCLILVFNPGGEAMSKWKEFYRVYITYPNYQDDYCIDHNLIALVFKVLPKYQGALEAFRSSRYSQMPKDYAELFRRVDMGSGVAKVTTEFLVMTKDKSYKAHLEESLDVQIDDRAELLDKLNLTQEIFDYPLT